jgi:cobalt-zinc-cadmium efflux system outer membrane protein
MFIHFAPRATKVGPAALLLALGGCHLAPPVQPAIPLTASSATVANSGESRASTHSTSALVASPDDTAIRQASAQAHERGPSTNSEKRRTLADRLRMPAALPGSDLPPPQLPLDDVNDPEKLGRAIDGLFPELPQLDHSRQPLKARFDPTELASLEQFALENHPAVAQAQAGVQSAIGTMVQSGMYPNPSVGYEADTVNTGRTRGYQGVLLTQTLKTAGKLDLQKCSAAMSLYNAQLALSKASVNVRTQVRRAYFALLVAQEQERIAEAMGQFTNEIFRVRVDQLKGGQVAPYEPMVLRALALQARGAFDQARNRTDAARRQLAAALGTPESVPSIVAGVVDLIGPRIEFDGAVEIALSRHTDVLSARNIVHKSRFDLRLAEVTPIPDVSLYGAVQKDFTIEPFGTTYNLQVSIPVPVFDRNQGAIRAAGGQLVRASEEERRLRSTLSTDLAAAFERYQTHGDLVRLYRDQIIPDQSRAYRGMSDQHQQEPEKATLVEIVTTQQLLPNSINAYLTSLNEYWLAVVDLAELLQLEDVFENIPGAWETSNAVPPEPLPPQ